MANQIIIKFRDPTPDPSRPEYMERLFRETGIKLIYRRPLSGGAHVFSLSDPAMDGAALKVALERLNKYPDIEYAEIDQRLHHMK
jgi:hypothetical protein